MVILGGIGYRYGGVLGPPTLFPARCFAALAALAGDQGARSLLTRHAAEVVAVDFPGGADDVDYETDVARLGLGDRG